MPTEPHPYPPYEILGVIGEGAFSTIYRVRHMHLGSVHALKVLTGATEGGLERMLQEGKIQAQLRHRNIVAVTDVLVGNPGEIGLVMEYVEGPTLADVIRIRHALPVEEALKLFEQILTAVAAAHGSGVLHRDLKPSNILLATEGRRRVVKITDFGLARAESRHEGLTAVGYGVGSPGYMAPEQARDAAKVDARADIFSLGAILYELVAGKPAFAPSKDYLATIRAAMAGDFVELDQVVPGCRPDVVEAVHRALAIKPEDRFPTCDAFAVALFGEELDDDPPSLPLDIGSLTAGSKQLEQASRVVPGRRPWISIAVGATLGVLLALLFAFVARFVVG